MTNAIAHFSINADDTDRARSFYEKVFGWSFQAWGPPGFWMIDAGDQPMVPLRASLQQRRALLPGVKMNGFECTIPVADVEKVAAAIVANGGTIVMPLCELAGIGKLCFFQDPEGNLAGAMQYAEGMK